VTLRTAALNIERVKNRVKDGGHSVPIKKIVARRERSFKQLPWFLDQADFALIYDNSDREPKLVGKKEKGVIVLDPLAPDHIKMAALTLEH
jgi:predicted ABC-type ATPase